MLLPKPLDSIAKISFPEINSFAALFCSSLSIIFCFLYEYLEMPKFPPWFSWHSPFCQSAYENKNFPWHRWEVLINIWLTFQCSQPIQNLHALVNTLKKTEIRAGRNFNLTPQMHSWIYHENQSTSVWNLTSYADYAKDGSCIMLTTFWNLKAISC